MTPSPQFIRLTRNPKMAAKSLQGRWIFRPTKKRPGDVVIGLRRVA